MLDMTVKRSTMHGLTNVVKGVNGRKVFVTTQRYGNVRVLTGTATMKGWGYSGLITPYVRNGKLEGLK